MSEPFYKALKQFIWPRYYEEGPPRYMDMVFFSKDFLDNNGQITEPVKSIIDLIVLGYRPVTSLSIIAFLVENGNKPMYGAQLGAQLEKRFELPKGWFTKARYYDTRIGKLLKIMQRQNILEERKVKDIKSHKEYVGYQITEENYPAIKHKILSFLGGGSISIFTSVKLQSPLDKTATEGRHCAQCGFMASSILAKYCERCGSIFTTTCSSCGKEVSLNYSFCLNCGTKIN